METFGLSFKSSHRKHEVLASNHWLNRCPAALSNKRGGHAVGSNYIALSRVFTATIRCRS